MLESGLEMTFWECFGRLSTPKTRLCTRVDRDHVSKGSVPLSGSQIDESAFSVLAASNMRGVMRLGEDRQAKLKVWSL